MTPTQSKRAFTDQEWTEITSLRHDLFTAREIVESTASEIVDWLRAHSHLPPSTCARVIGVDPKTLTHWLAQEEETY